MFESPFGESILKRAQDQELLNISLHDLRKYTLDKHRKTDDHPFGGGVGLIMNVDPIVRAIETVKESKPGARSIYFLQEASHSIRKWHGNYLEKRI